MKRPQSKALVRWVKHSVVGECKIEYIANQQKRGKNETALEYIIHQLLDGPRSIDFFVQGTPAPDTITVSKSIQRCKAKCAKEGFPKIMSDFNKKARLTWYFFPHNSRITRSICLVDEGMRWPARPGKRTSLTKLLKVEPTLTTNQLRVRGYPTYLIHEVRAALGIPSMRNSTEYLQHSDFDHIPLPPCDWNMLRVSTLGEK